MNTIVYAKKSDFASSTDFLQALFSIVCGIPNAKIEKTAKGKPFLANLLDINLGIDTEKTLGTAMEFSLTHTDRLYVAALSDAPVGIDAGPLQRQIEYEKIAKRRFPEADAKSTRSQKDFLFAWTAREAYVKFSGSTLAESLKNLCFSQENLLVTHKTLGAFPVRFFEIENHLVAVCAHAPFQPDEIRAL